MDIIWSCLVTIFACSWTVTHPDSRGTGGTQYTSKAWLCIVAVVAPEVLAFVAFSDYLTVKHGFNIINKTNKCQWTMSQLFFVHMQGVDLEFADCTETLGFDSHGVFDVDEALGVLQRALQLNILDKNCISAVDVEKRAKTIYIVKALVCLQVSGLVAQVIGRAVAKLSITTLKVVTIGYVICALITYSCWWHKPQDAEVVITINCRRLTKANFHQRIEALQANPFVKTCWDTTLQCGITVVFGAIHCTAWNFFFSTVAKSVTWRVASVLTAVFPNLICVWFSGKGKVNVPLIFIYVPVRLYLVIEPFVAFRSIPVGIFYTVNWSTWIPHV